MFPISQYTFDRGNRSLRCGVLQRSIEGVVRDRTTALLWMDSAFTVEEKPDIDLPVVQEPEAERLRSGSTSPLYICVQWKQRQRRMTQKSFEENLSQTSTCTQTGL